MQVYDGEIVGLIGPNGAGKTTVFNLLTKVYKPTRGKIYFDGKDTAGKNVVSINKAGIARTFQNIRLFGNLTVLDNVKTGFHNVIPYSSDHSDLRLPKYFAGEKEINEKARDLLKIMDWTSTPISRRAIFPTAPRDGLRSPEHWLRIPNFFFWMSLPQA